MPHTLYVARHGLRANLDPSPTGIDGDPRLTPEGDVQAQELAEEFNRLSTYPPIGAIYSSPFFRCLETASFTAHKLGLPIFVERGLSEYYQPGRPTKPVPWTARKSKKEFNEFYAIDEGYYPQVDVSPRGENRPDLRERVRACLRCIFAHAAAHGYQSIIVLTHAAVKITIGEVLVGLEGRAGTCSLDTYNRSGDAIDSLAGWTAESLGNTSFLSEGEQMHWAFDMAFEAGSAEDVASRLPKFGVVKSGPDYEARPLVSLDLSALPVEDQPRSLDPKNMEFDNLETDRPLVRIGDKIYEGEWQHVIGSEVYTSAQGEQLGSAHQRIKLLAAQIKTPQKDRRPLSERVKDARKD